MPDANDDYEDFRSEFNGNMLILDGAGGGGHVIVDENGNDMPQEAKLQFTGGVNVTDDNGNGATIVNILGGGGGNVFGAFVNTNRIITSGTYTASNPLSYTATEDCYIYSAVSLTNNTAGLVRIDGELVGNWYNGGGTTTYNFEYYLRRGQTLTATQTFSGTTNYAVYGLIQGTESIFTPIIYSDNERMIGIWRDNKPLYQKSFPFTVNLSSGQTATVDTISGYENIVLQCGWINKNNIYYTLNEYGIRLKVNTSGQIQITSATGSSWYGSGYVTLQYTKSSDVAGSGDWNTDGIPTIHYSTNEQVIGTWIDGKPIYQTTYSIGTIAAGASAFIPHNISDLKRLIACKGVGYITAENRWTELPKVDNDASYQRSFSVSDTNIVIGNSVNAQQLTDVCVTLQYTKTTD